MKKLNYLLSMFAVTSMLFVSSCTEDEEVIPVSNPDVVLEMNTTSPTASTSATLETAPNSGNKVLQITSVTSSSEDQKRLYIVKKNSDNETSVFVPSDGKTDGSGDYYIDIPNDSKNNFTAQVTVPTSLVATAVQDVYTFYFTKGVNFNPVQPDSDDIIATGTITIKYVTSTEGETKDSTTALSAAADFTWKRVGSNNGTGLSTFGLAWTSNSATNAKITKDGATKLVKLSSSDWTSITTQEALKTKIDAATDMTTYEGVSSQSDQTYTDEVLGVVNGGTYHILNIKSSDVAVAASLVAARVSQTTITITGEYKK